VRSLYDYGYNFIRTQMATVQGPDSFDAIHGQAQFRVGVRIGQGMHQPHIERGLAAIAGDLQHVVDAWIDPRRAQPFGAFGQGFDIGLEGFVNSFSISVPHAVVSFWRPLRKLVWRDESAA